MGFRLRLAAASRLMCPWRSASDLSRSDADYRPRRVAPDGSTARASHRLRKGRLPFYTAPPSSSWPTRGPGYRSESLGMTVASNQSLRLVIAGGGTGGHVLPALAVVEELRGRGHRLELLWIGSHGDVEGPAAERAGIPF